MPRDNRANELLLVKGFYEARQAHHRQTSFASLTSSCKASGSLGRREGWVLSREQLNQNNGVQKQSGSNLRVYHLSLLYCAMVL